MAQKQITDDQLEGIAGSKVSGAVSLATTVTTNANLSGDVTSSGNTTTLANTAVTPGSYTSTNLTVDSKGRITAASNGSGGGSGTVTDVSVVSANGLAGSVATSTTTPAITLSTSVTGIVKGNGTALSAATSGTDFSAGTSALATGILKSTTTTGALTIAVAGDFPTLNQNTTGTAAGLSATLAVGSGGTGLTTLTANNVILGNGSSTPTFVAPGTSGNVLTSDGTTWTSAAAGGGSSSNTYKEAVRGATTANLASLSGNLSVDGLTTAAGERWLVKNQTTASQNGIYVASASAWTRATDFDTTGAEVANGAIIPIQFGTTNGGSTWQLITNGGTIGNNFVFMPVNGLAAANRSTWTVPTATNTNSFAIGSGSAATGSISLAIGNNSVANAGNALAIGVSASSTNTDAIAIGPSSSATQVNNVAIGKSVNATATATLSIGATITNSGQNSIVLGHSASNTGSFNVVLGNGANGQDYANSVVIGRSADAGVSTGEVVVIGSGAYASGSGTQSVVVGRGAYSSGAAAIAIGINANAQNNSVIAIGGRVSGLTAVGIGNSSIVNNRDYSWQLGGAIPETMGEMTFQPFANTGMGVAYRVSWMPIWTSTSSTTPVEFGAAANSHTPTNRITLTNNSTYLFDIDIVARKSTAGTDYSAWNVKFCINREANAASTALVGSVTKTLIGQTAGASTWDVTVTADTTNGRPAISAVGQAATNIRWCGNVRMTRVNG